VVYLEILTKNRCFRLKCPGFKEPDLVPDGPLLPRLAGILVHCGEKLWGSVLESTLPHGENKRLALFS
jgi:hypothetical protein